MKKEIFYLIKTKYGSHWLNHCGQIAIFKYKKQAEKELEYYELAESKIIKVKIVEVKKGNGEERSERRNSEKTAKTRRKTLG